MKKILLIAGIVCFTFIAKSGSSQTKNEPTQYKKVEEYYSKLRSTDFNIRELAVYYLSQSPGELDKKIINMAIDLFMKEIENTKKFNELIKLPGRIENKVPKDLLYMNREAFGLYWENLCNIVGKSKDARVLPLLAEYHPDPRLLNNNFGELVVDPVLHILKTSDNAGKRANEVRVLGYLLEDKKEGYIASEETRERIKKELVTCAVTDGEFGVRLTAVRALGKAGNEDLISVLEKIAITDPYHFERKAVAGIDKDVAPGLPVTRYPVRLVAQEALKKLREGKKKE
jgi:HEAT repeats